MTDKTIRFNVDSREVTDYQSKMREQQKSLSSETTSYARTQSEINKENIKLLEEEIKVIEKKMALNKKSWPPLPEDKEQPQVDSRKKPTKPVTEQNQESRLRDLAKSDAVEMVSYARTQSTSAKEILSILEEQVKAKQKSNSLDREMALFESRSKLDSGKITKKEFSKEVTSIENQFTQDNLQVKLLRELIDVTRITSKDEIRADRETAEKFSQEQFSDDELENLRRLHTQDQLDREKKPTPPPEQSMRMPGVGGQLMTSLASGNMGGLVSGLLMILGAGGVAAALGAITINATRQYENELQSYAVANQIPVNSISVSSLNRPGLGLSGKDIAQKTGNLMRSYGGKLDEGNDGSVEGLLGAGISRGISDQALNQLMSISRFSGTPAIGTIGNMEDYLNKMSRPLIRLPEMLDIYLSKANELLQRGGVVHSSGLQQTMMSLSSSYGVEGMNLQRMMNSIGSAAGPQSSNPIMESLKLQTLQEMYPGMSQWEKFGQMEHALSNPDYIKALIEKVKEMSAGGGESYQKFALANLLNLGYEDVNRLMSGELTVEQITTPSGKTNEERGNELSSKYESEAKLFAGNITNLSTELVSFKEAMVDIMGGISRVMTGQADNIESMATIMSLFKIYISPDKFGNP
jgi:hypothetical protein